MGKKHGHGKFTSMDKSTYEGQFVEDAMEGKGACLFKDGRTFDGQWHNSQIHGHGKMIWADNRCYEGNYIADKKSGAGVFTWPDGRRYEGLWQNGKQHGVGSYTDSKGRSR